VVGGIVTGLRTVVTKAGAQMAIATIEDLQGSIEIVVFPRLYEQTRPVWVDGRILLVARRIDHKGEEISLLADLAVDWDDAVTQGPDAFAREVAAGDRGGRRRPVAAAPAATNGNGNGSGYHAPQPVAAGAGGEAPVAMPPMVSPIRADAEAPPAPLPPIAPPMPVPTYVEPDAGPLDDDRDTEPAVPDEARDRILSPAASDANAPVDARAGAVLHVRFARHAAPERLVGAMEAFKAVLRDRPGATRVIIHVPGPSGGEPLPMELRRGVAYDAELLAEVRRRLGEGVIDLQLA